MQLQIKIITIENESVPNKSGKGSYQKLTVTYKDLGSGKIDGRQVFGFGESLDAFNALSIAQANDVYTIEAVKGEKYWNWVNAWKSDAAPPVSKEQPNKDAKAPSSTFARDFETKEERKVKQVYIIRQSSLSNAVTYCGPGADLDTVLDVARKFENYVLDLVGDDPADIEVQ